MDYKISRSTRTCIACEKQFNEGEEYFAAIFEGPEQFLRKEFCAACWAGDTGREAAEGSYSHWKVRVPEKPAERKHKLDVRAASTFFRRLAGSDEPHKRDFAYLLALLLMRKKVLVQRETTRNGEKDFMVLRFRGEDEDYRTEDPHLPAEALERVKDDLGSLLNMDTETQPA